MASSSKVVLVLGILLAAAHASAWQPDRRPALASALRLHGGGRTSVSDSAELQHKEQKELEQQQQRRRLQRGRITTVLSLYGTALLNGMARRTLSSAMPVLVADGAWTQEQAKEISFLGYQGYALGRVLAIPALITFGHKGTMLLNLAVICMATMGFVLAGMYGGVHALSLQKCCWFSIKC